MFTARRLVVPFVIVLVLFALSLPLTACGGGGGGGGGKDDGALLITPDGGDLRVGETLQLAASAAGVVWASADAGIAVVDPAGRVCGCAPGTVRITARGPQDATATVDVHVLPDDSFNETLPDDVYQVEPTYERKSGLGSCEVTLHLSGVASRTRVHRWRKYHALDLLDASLTSVPGTPEIPYFKLLFAIPVDVQTGVPASYAVQVQRSDVMTYDDVRPWPSQPPRWVDSTSADGGGGTAFQMNAAAYATQSPFPGQTHATSVAQCGDLHLLEVAVFPVRYLAGSRRLEVSATTTVSVTFSAQSGLRDAAIVGAMTPIEARGGDEWLAEIVQNGDRIRRLGANDLVTQLPLPDLKGIQDEPFELLIVTRPDLYDPAYELGRHRQDEGVRVRLVSLSPTTYQTAEQVRDVILDLDDANRYECSGGERPHAMRAILLFGDCEIIPPCQGMNYRNGADPGVNEAIMTVGTDLFYATLRGLDHHPDVAIGRISVDDKIEGAAVVAKIVAYESYAEVYRPGSMAAYGLFDDEPEERTVISGQVTLTTNAMGDPIVQGVGTSFLGQVRVGDVVRGEDGDEPDQGDWKWWGRVADVVSNTEIELESAWRAGVIVDPDGLQVGFQDGVDDWEFVKAAERVRDFMLRRGLAVRYGYVQRDGPTPTAIFDGVPLAADLVGYGWNATTLEVQDNWREGADGIVLHSDHGAPWGWYHPRFESGDLVNVRLPTAPSDPSWYPIVLSVNCDSGWFDTETMTIRYRDAVGAATKLIWAGASGAPVGWLPPGYNVPTHDECFCEEVLLDPLGGGVAAVGGCRGTDADKNDKLVDGLFAGFYADYREGCIPHGPGTRYAYDRLGDVVRAAKFRQYIVTSTPTDLGGLGSVGQARYNMETWHLFGDPMLRVRPPGEPLLVD